MVTTSDNINPATDQGQNNKKYDSALDIPLSVSLTKTVYSTDPVNKTLSLRGMISKLRKVSKVSSKDDLPTLKLGDLPPAKSLTMK